MGIKTNECFVYGLIDPSTKQLRYIGLSSSGMNRPLSHFRPSQLAKDTNLHKRRWIEKLAKQGLQPEIEVLERCANREELAEAEVFQIQYYKSIGADLMNMAEGGYTGNTVPRTDETKKKMSDSKVKQWANNSEYKEKMTTMFQDYWSKPENREAQRQRWTSEKREAQRKRGIDQHSKGKFILTGTGEEFESAASFARRIGVTHGAVNYAVKNNRASIKGKEFKFMPK